MRLTPFVAVFALTLAPTLAQAAGETNGTITAMQGDAPNGAHVQGALDAIYRFDESGSSAPTVAFAMKAADVRVDTYEVDPLVVAGPLSANAPMVGYSPASHAYANAAVESTIARPAYKFAVVSHGAALD